MKKLGALLLLVAIIVLVEGYGNKPSGQACNYVNSITPQSCSSSTPVLAIVLAVIFGVIGIALILAPGRRM